ncbi:MAG: TetR/AcrR family transcriptional regulator [Corynebacterium variabile]|uniref:TetR/AcrR family transcriptional regulator n=1 Tax=Corynebacterium variabile TaxID=1727 RepID=UPI003FBA62CA
MPRHLFDRPQIITAARRILDADGLDALTIRALASDLETGPASVYRHVADRQQLLQLVADDAARELPLPDPALAPRERLHSGWLMLYDFFAGRPWLVDLITAGNVVSDHASPLADAHLQALAELGLDQADRYRTYRSLNALLLGTLCSTHPYAHGAVEAEDSADPTAHESAPREVFAWAVDRLI